MTKIRGTVICTKIIFNTTWPSLNSHDIMKYKYGEEADLSVAKWSDAA